MKNKSTQVVISILIAIAVVATVLQLLKVKIVFVPLLNLLFLIKLIVVALIVRDGTFIKSTIYSAAAGVSAVVIAIGSLFKIMHWPGADVTLMVGFSLMMVIYSLWYALNKPKKILDFVKWFWVVTLCLSLLCRIFNWSMKDIVEIVQEGAFVILMALYLVGVISNRSIVNNDVP